MRDDKMGTSCNDGCAVTTILRGGSHGSTGSGSGATGPLAHRAASARSQAYHSQKGGATGPPTNRTRPPPVLPLAGLVYGLVCHRPGAVLPGLLPPNLPLVAALPQPAHAGSLHAVPGPAAV